MDQPTPPVHASCVAVAGRAILILGASGSGKTTLALQLLAFGADLVADDRTLLARRGTSLIASCPPTLSGLIEARGVGVLNVPPAGPTPVSYAVDMDRVETERIPQRREITLNEITIPLFYKVDGIHFAPAMYHLLRHGRSTR